MKVDLFESTSQITIDSCVFPTGFYYKLDKSKEISQVKISNSIVNQFYKPAWGMDGDLILGGMNLSLELRNVKFDCDTIVGCWLKIGGKEPPMAHKYVVGDNDIDRILFKDCLFRTDISFDGLNCPTSFDVVNCKFEGDISFSKVIIPLSSNVYFKWENFSNKLSFINRNWRFKYNDLGEFVGLVVLPMYKHKAIDDTAISNTVFYDEFTAIYNEFITIYKERGDIKSRNACYKELKDFETRRLKYLWKTEGGSTHFLNWQLNVFLKYFAEYGTSPIRSLIVSFWVILCFAVVYFFSKSDWDNINRQSLIKQARQMMGYFSSEQKLDDFYSETYKEDLASYSEFKSEIKAMKKEVPFFFLMLLKPLYYLSVVKHRMSSFAYRKMEILSGKWSDLSDRRKFVTGTLVSVGIFSYLTYLLLFRALNSIMLSVNTFSTLGFGDIPVGGATRYVAIIEGFIGWFLLSIFSVSLISQILQS
ncbi:MAG: two pore domain potassium channel family protein [Flavobacteriales bacterium]|nr:two pore domain potassium channel family protein [Flavobacteriales bacterium]